MASSEILAYIKEQLKAGYSPEEIRAALAQAGWTEEEIAEALPPEASAVEPPVDVRPPGSWGFRLSLIGGLVASLFGIGTLLSLPQLATDISQGGLSLEMLGYLERLLGSNLSSGVIVLIFSLVVVVGSLAVKRGGRAGGVLVLVFSLLILFGFKGILPLAGGILGIVGGILGIRRG